MFKNKIIKNNGIISKDLLQRIDSINDDKEYDPYKALKRTTVSSKELFNESDYEIQDDDVILRDEEKVKKEKRTSLIIGLIVMVLMLSVLGGLVYIAYTGGIKL